MYLSPRKKLFVDTASEMFGNGSIISKAMMKEAADKCGVPLPYWMHMQCKVGDSVLFLKNSARKVEVDGEELMVIREADLETIIGDK